jgi:hypothetical protein
MTNKKGDGLYDLAFRRVILRNVTTWFVLTFLIFVHSLRGQIAPFSELHRTICGDVIFLGQTFQFGIGAGAARVPITHFSI